MQTRSAVFTAKKVKQVGGHRGELNLHYYTVISQNIASTCEFYARKA